jgi:hypothetical protein
VAGVPVRPTLAPQWVRTRLPSFARFPIPEASAQKASYGREHLIGAREALDKRQPPCLF